MKEELSLCPKCFCMTKSIRLGRAKYQCGKCKVDKSLSDVYYYECMEKQREMGEQNEN
jgi:hypothetical protein